MEFDFVSEVDKKFCSDDFLLNEDWGNADDLSCLLSVDNDISADEFIRSLPDELGIPMLDTDMLMDHDLLKATSSLPVMSDPMQELSDGSDSGLDCGSVVVKDEPPSPASSHSSDTLLDGASVQYADLNLTQVPTFAGVLPMDIKLESPPLTPERDQPTDIVDLTKTVAQPSNCVKIEFSKNNQQTLPTANLPPGAKILTGANGVRIIQSPIKNNVTQVLNSKVKIQPKPPAVALQPKPTAQVTGTTKPLVLTAEEFAKLTQQGVLKFQHPDNTSTQVVTSTSTPTPPTILTAPPTIHRTAGATKACSNPGEYKIAKRQQRMIKNRESACLSRKRKKEYLHTVEQQLAHFSDENQRLKEQNDQLKKRIQMLQDENDKLKLTSPGSQIKKATVVFGVLFLISLNLGPLTGILHSSSPTKAISSSSAVGSLPHHSRTLLAFNDNVVSETPNTQEEHQKSSPGWPSTSIQSITAALEGLRKVKMTNGALPRDLMMVKRLEEMNIPISMCPSYFNSSESERLMNELTGWVLGHKAGMKAAADAADKVRDSQQERTKQQSGRRHQYKKYAAPRKLKAAMKGNIPQEEKESQYQVQMFTPPDRDYQDFLRAIHRRNDTFYVVSFRRDHLLLPATAHNQTTRPRMSLLMPAVSTNETMDLPAGNIAMMQIDCEVTATKLLHVHKSAVPTPEEGAAASAPPTNTNHTTPSPSVDNSRNPAAHSAQHRRKWQQQHKSKWRP